jgi:exopolysaccharide biosynthesis polyprenyl glycosylphosphotransferase
MLIDLVAVTATIGIAVVGRRHLDVFQFSADLSGDLTLIGPLLVLAWVALIGLLGGYRLDLFGATTEEYRRVLNGSLLTAGVLGVGCYLARYQLSRGFFFLVFAVGIPALILGRFLLRRVIHRARRRGLLQQRVVVAGSLSHIDEIVAVLRREPWLGYDVVGALTPPHELARETGFGVPVLGNADDVVAIANEAEADTIFFAGGAVTSSHSLRELIWELEHESFGVVVAPSVSEISSDRISVRPVAGLPLMHIDPPGWKNAARIGKRLFDLAGAALVVLLASPLLAFCAISVWASDGGPVFFRQTRIGRDGVEFRCLKFRTMIVDAENQLGELRTAETVNGVLFKMKDDPRITKPGRWLRRFSFDELPQLFNVLRGDMSLVGPRPPLPREVLSYASQTSRRLRVRPGMTGLWQVSGRSDLSFEEAIRLDLYYIDNWSMVQDIIILYRTVGAVVSSRGAY